MNIVETGNYRLLLVSGVATPENFIEAWEGIVRANSEASNSYEYDNYFMMMQDYGDVISRHVADKALLIYLAFVIDYEMIEEARRRGYAIDITNTQSYSDSLTSGLKRVGNLVTQMTMKRNELEALVKEGGSNKGTSVSFDNILASLSMALGFTVPEDITLARYNEYKKLLEKSRAKRQAA